MTWCKLSQNRSYEKEVIFEEFAINRVESFMFFRRPWTVQTCLCKKKAWPYATQFTLFFFLLTRNSLDMIWGVLGELGMDHLTAPIDLVHKSHVWIKTVILSTTAILTLSHLILRLPNSASKSFQEPCHLPTATQAAVDSSVACDLLHAGRELMSALSTMQCVAQRRPKATISSPMDSCYAGYQQRAKTLYQLWLLSMDI